MIEPPMNRAYLPPGLPGRPLLLSLLIGLAPLLATPAAAAPAEPRTVLTVAITQPQTLSWPVTLTADGGLHAWQEAVIAAETGGLRITELLADVGDPVKHGQPLARLARETVEAELAQRRANVAQAQAALSQARADAGRARGVKGSGALSDQQSSSYLTGEESAAAALAAAQAALKSTEIRLDQTQILAVDDGVISSRSATLGQVVQTGSELFRMIRQGRIEWRGELTAEQLTQARPGQAVDLRLPGGDRVAGTVRMVAPTLDPITRKGLLYADLPSSDTPLRPGVFAQGEVRLADTPALTLPATAVVWSDGFAYLFELDAEGIAHRRKVRIGRMQGDRVEVLEGVAAGAAVVVSGGAFLHEGDRVRVEGER
jgi:HlyD family secretion protein